MPFPLLSEYIEAIKSAEDNFKELTNLRPVLTDDGQPVMTSGNFAVVFKMQDGQSGKNYALKCFTREQEGREEAYHQIAEELKDADSPYLVSFRYLDKELFVDTTQTDETEFPVLLMDWVDGKTLDKYLRENLDDEYELEMLAYRFSQLAQWIIPLPFAHGDLKPDNILVREDGTLVLVDYDGMYVPAMKGQKARELGSPDFRHPRRTEDDFDEHIDDFPLVSILLSLKCISINTGVCYDLEQNEGIILHESDFRDIANSKANKAILNLINNTEIARLYATFIVILSEKKLDDNTFMLYFKDKEQEKFLKSLESQSLWSEDDKYCLSCCLRNGFGCDRNTKQSTVLLQQLAEQENIPALRNLAICYCYGKGVNQNYNKAVSLFTVAAEKGDTKALYNLGVSYQNGHGVEQSYGQAYKWYRRAAEKELATAQYNLGICYYKGQGVAQSYKKAVEWFAKAAEQGHVKAQHKLGLCYKKGQGVVQSYKKAVEWFAKAAEQGHAPAQFELGQCYYSGMGVAQSDEKVFEWYAKAAKQGHALAQMGLGYCYERSIGVYQHDYKQAILWYMKSADQGHARAQFRLGLCYERGIGVYQDDKKAFMWYMKAAEQGVMEAQFELGNFYECGRGTDSNHNKAKFWYEKAAEQGHVGAHTALGISDITNRKLIG